MPSQKNALALTDALKNYSIKATFSPKILALEDIGEEKSSKVINPITRTLLFMQFILKCNEKNKENLPLTISYEIASLLDKIDYNHVLEIVYNTNYIDNKDENFSILAIKTLCNTLKDLSMLDIPEYKNNCINDLTCSWKKNNEKIILFGAEHSITYKTIAQAVHNLPFGTIILPNLNLEISEENWQSIDKNHYQYYLKELINFLGKSRKDIRYLGNATTNKIIDYIFDTTSSLSSIDTGNNIEIITCNSREEEAQVISLITKNEEYVSLFVSDELLAIRTQQKMQYSYITFLLCTIKVITSGWESIALLSLLKHPFLNLGYTRDRHRKIVSEFEIQVRKFNISKVLDIENAVNDCINKEDILVIFKALKDILNPLDNINCSIHEIASTHLKCIYALSNINFVNSDNEVCKFMLDFTNACKNIQIVGSLDLYNEILTLFLKKEFFSPKSDLTKFDPSRVIILANFNEGSYPPSFQNSLCSSEIRKKFNLPNTQEEYGYFMYHLYNLFHADKIYITNQLGKKPIILKRLETLIQNKPQPYKEWLKCLSTPKYTVPSTKPQPKPKIDVREKVMEKLSFTKITKLMRDPYAFYAEYILNIKKLKDLNRKPSILEFGTLVHKIFQEYCHKNNDESLSSILEKKLSACDFYFSNLWLARLNKTMQNFIMLHHTRKKNCSYIEVEQTFSFRILEKILLSAKCDRVEHLLNDKIAVIDYKLGSTSETMQLLVQGTAVQNTVGKEILDLEYWKFDYGQINIVQIKFCEKEIQKLKDNLSEIVLHYLNESTPFTVSPNLEKFLKFNDYKHLERIEEWL
ncbi:PD-(D/E)XK nuclease family protein [Wolbachia endosymbiont of Pentidionis agamae]|uniref:PD-(D/E)XK nuclease family protein n=1 Tax=Wolbachia endosymbiont of Pentidionis agamae TaxID=3110435 RepID=UPI002FD67161